MTNQEQTPDKTIDIENDNRVLELLNYYSKEKFNVSYEQLKEESSSDYKDLYNLLDVIDAAKTHFYKEQIQSLVTTIAERDETISNQLRTLELDVITIDQKNKQLSEAKATIESLTKDYPETQNWFEWLCARIPHIKEGAYAFWIKQALQGYADEQVKPKCSFLQDGRYTLPVCLYCGMPGWISVKELLPDKYETVLVLHENGNVNRSLWNNLYKKWHFYGCIHVNITHWMPLPNKPE